MKKSFFLIGATVWVIIAVAALTLLIASMSGGKLSANLPNWMRFGSVANIFDANTTLLKEETFSLSDISELDVSTQYQSIRITLISGNEMTVRHYDIDSAAPFSGQAAGGALKISIPRRNDVSINMANPRLEIDLPGRYATVLKLESTSGSIDFEGYPEFTSLALSSSSGAIRLEDGAACRELNVRTGSGSISMGNLYAGTLSFSSSSGTLRLEEVSSAGDVTLITTSGSINSKNIVASNLRIQSSSGVIRIGNVDSISRVDISTSSGSHNVGFVKAEMYNISAISGTLRYDGLSGAGRLDSTSGSIDCEALDVKGNVTISSLSGTKRITLAPDQNFDIKISTTSGTIRAADFALFYSDNRGKNAFGTVGDGSAGTLNIQSTSGSISID